MAAAAAASTSGRDRPVARVAPSLLAADFGELSTEARRVVAAGADWLHVDVAVRAPMPPAACRAPRSPKPPISSRPSQAAPLKPPTLTCRPQDGHFARNLAFGPPSVAALRAVLPGAFLDCHCAVNEPGRWVAAFAAAGASQFTFHVEAGSMALDEGERGDGGGAPQQQQQQKHPRDDVVALIRAIRG